MGGNGIIHRLIASAPVAALALAGCGGGGSASAVAVVSQPGPTPTSTPTATPTPSPVYAQATDFSADRDYPGWGVRIVTVYTAPPRGAPAGAMATFSYSAAIADETRAAGFTYAAATRTYTARWFADLRPFGPAASDVVDGFLPYDFVGTDFYRTPFRISPAVRDYTRYVGNISWSIYTGNGNFIFDSETREHVSIYGSPTVASDLPVTGTATVRLTPTARQVGLAATYIVGVDDLRLSIDWATGAITGTWVATPQPTAPAGTPNLSLTLTGRLNTGSSRLMGTITGSGFTGSFTGAVFGPRAQEIGLAYQMSDGRGGVIAGTTATRSN